MKIPDSVWRPVLEHDNAVLLAEVHRRSSLYDAEDVDPKREEVGLIPNWTKNSILIDREIWTQFIPRDKSKKNHNYMGEKMGFKNTNLKIMEAQTAGNTYPRQWTVRYSQLHGEKPNNIQDDS